MFSEASGQHYGQHHTTMTYTTKDTPADTPTHKRKSPSTRSRSWLRAIAWRKQMGLLPEAHLDQDDLPSLVACDAVQQRYLRTTETIDQACFQGVMEYEVARELKREMFAWATMQTCLLARIEELEVDNINYEGEMRKCKEYDTKTQDETPHNDVTQHDRPDNRRKVYDASKCRQYIKPVNFISGGIINAPVNSKISHTQGTQAKYTNTMSHTHKQEPAGGHQTRLTHKTEPQPKLTIIKSKDTETTENTTNWNHLNYDGIEENLRLSRLENKDIFQTAQRHVVRLTHPKGHTICFPNTEQTDRMLLRAENLPTDPRDLCDLLRKACTRRSEGLDIESIYKDLARAHGRVYFDPQQSGHKCFVFTKYP